MFNDVAKTSHPPHDGIVYALKLGVSWIQALVIQFGVPAVMAAFAGVLIGNRWLHKVTMAVIQVVTGFLLLAISFALGVGII